MLADGDATVRSGPFRRAEARVGRNTIAAVCASLGTHWSCAIGVEPSGRARARVRGAAAAPIVAHLRAKRLSARRAVVPGLATAKIWAHAHLVAAASL